MSDDRAQALALLIEQAERDEHNLPPVETWHPENVGEIDIRIASDGRWFHEGDEIKRIELVKLFSSVLRKEGETYFLVTPVEKLKIQVDDAPFFAHGLEVKAEGDNQALVFTTNVGSIVIADASHPIHVAYPDGAAGEPRPYLRVRKNLNALISRNVFYQMIDIAEETIENSQAVLSVCSRGAQFLIGRYAL